jgi:undecaprenyl-diphosphatase
VSSHQVKVSVINLQKLVNRRSLDRTVIMLLITAFVGLCLFACLTALVESGRTLYLDDLLLTHLRRATNLNVPIGPYVLLNAARDITALGDVTVLAIVTIMTLGYCLLTRYYTAFFMVFVAVNSGDLLMVLLKEVFKRHRPDVVPHLVDAAYTSFPSGHAMMSAVVYLTIGAILARIEPRKKVKIYLLSVFSLLPLVIGMSRVYLGVHYPSDVIAGWVAGITWGTLCAALVLTVSKKVKSGVNEQ